MCSKVEKCSVCLNLTENTGTINEFATNNESWLTKLQRIVPEIEWLEFYKICNHCTKQLDEISEFRRNCIELDKIRKENYLLKVEAKIEEISDIKFLIETTSEECFSCYHCEETFQSKIVLTQHIRSQHSSRHQCSECEKSFLNQNLLKKHLRKVHDLSGDRLRRKKKNYECGKCGKLYTQEKVMTNHLLNCDGIKRHKKATSPGYSCDNCLKSYTTEKILKSHLKKCSVLQLDKNEVKEMVKKVHQTGRRSTKIFSCEICGDTQNYAKQIIEHCIKQHSMDPKSIKPYSCNKCDSRFSSSANLVQHEKYHEGSRTHICSFCGKSYITKSDLTVHEYTHYNRRNYKCELCEKAFNTNKNLRSHKLVVHTDSSLWKYGCTMCEKRFPLKSGYEQHIRRHTGDKRFICHICTKPFISRSELQKHFAFHSNVRAFQCEHCQKEYKERKIYEIHLAKVHGLGDAKVPVRIKKFACHICPNTYFDRQKLARHLCIHSGLKPFSCGSCDKKFTDKYYLKQHLKSAHNIVEVEVNNSSEFLSIKTDGGEF